MFFTVGLHGVIYGERGVGKTSLAAVSANLLTQAATTVRVNCDVSDDFASLWTKVVEDLIAKTRSLRYSHVEGFSEAAANAIEILSYDETTPSRVRQALQVLTEVHPLMIFFDEFDRVPDESDTRILIADTIKGVSDHLVNATLIVVGVADDVESLIAQHQSISRNLKQVHMPRMEPGEMEDIIAGGFERLQISAPPDVMHTLVHVPQGLPHFAHLLAQEAARLAVLTGRNFLTEDDCSKAIAAAIDQTDEDITRRYNAATRTHQAHALFETILLACALAIPDETGYFMPGELRDHLERITSEKYDFDRFNKQLKRFCEDRGPVLERRGRGHQWRYRFINPMMRPYVIMKALDRGVDSAKLNLAPPPGSPSERGQLF